MEYHKGAAEEATKGNYSFLQSKSSCRHPRRLALEEARSTVKVHEDKVEELEQTLFELRGKIGAGNHVPPGMRVLCLRDNPAQQWSDLRQSVMDRLKSENEALIKRLRDLESSGVSAQAGTSRGEELVPRESWEVLHKEKEELEEVVKQKEKRLLRLQQVHSSLRLISHHSNTISRSSRPRAPSSEKRSHRSWGSSSPSTRTDR